MSAVKKIYNNITPTSNVFAVYWTVGFFEVVDETVKPARLGQEIGLAQNKHIRHRFFAIVDRSGLQLFKGTTAANAAGAIKAGQGKTVTLNTASFSSMSNTAAAYVATQTYVPGNIVTSGGNVYLAVAGPAPNVNFTPPNALYWQPLLQVGMLLEITDSVTPAKSEVVAVTAVGVGTFTANFTQSYSAGSTIVCRGNPGPQTVYNPHDDPGVVLHMSVIK